MAEGFRIAAAYVEVSPDTSGFKEELEEQLEEATAGVHADVSVGLDTSDLDAQIEEVKEKLADLDGMRVEPSIGLDKADLDASVDEAKDKLDDLDSKKATPKLGLDKADFDAKKDDADKRLDDNDARTASPKLGLDKADFDAEMDDAEARLDAFNTKSANARVGASGGGEGGGGGGSLLGAASLGLGALMPGIGGAAMGMGAIAGTLGLAFGGISKTLSAAYQSSQNVGLTGAQVASTAYDNAVAVRQAQESVQQAFMQSAESSVSSAQQIEQSQMNLGSVERAAAESQIQAVQSVTQAQQQLEEANYGLSEAQYNLSDAWIQARYDLEQLKDQEQDSATTIAAAKLAVQQAQYQQLLTDQNAYSTSLDRAQASIAVTQAQESLTAAQQQATYTQQEYNLQEAHGVAGSQQVVQAKQAVVQAVYGQQDAQAQMAAAQLNLTDTELNNAEQIKSAQLGVAEAQEQAAWSQQQNALAVKEAEQNLTSTIEEQKLQWAATELTANAAANQFAKDFARLTPAGKAFVNQVLSMKGAFKELEDAAQDAVLPGFSIFLSGIAKLMPDIQGGVTQMGGAISQAFGQFGKQMQTAQFAKVFNGLISNGIQFANIVLPAFAQFIQELAWLGSGKGAVSGLANLLAGLAHGLTGLAGSLKPYIPVINQFLTAVGHILTAAGPALGQMIGLVATALGPLSRYLNAHPNGTVVKVLGDIAAGLLAVKGLQKVLPDFISGPLGKLAASGGEMLLSPFTAAAKALPGLAASVGKMLLSPFVAAAKALPGVVSDIFGPAMKMAGKYISGLAGQIPGKLSAAWDLAGQGFTKVFGAGGLIERGFGAVSGYASQAGGAIAGFAENLAMKTASGAGSVFRFAQDVAVQMAAAAGSAVRFVASMGKQLAEAAVETGAWLAEHAAATAAFIAENVAQAASATAAFIAENAATLGIAAAIALLVTAVVYLATHWKQVFTDVKNWTLDVWHNVLDPFFKTQEQAALNLYHDAIYPMWQGIDTAFHGIETVAMWLWHDVLDPWFSNIGAGFTNLVNDIEKVWDRLESVFKTPVDYLIKVVYTNGIERLWNDVVGAIGLGSIKLPNIAGLAHGGVVGGGYSPGHDTKIAAVSPGEGILTPQATHAIGGKDTVDALNKAYPPNSGAPKSGSAITSALMKEPLHQARRRTLERPAIHGAVKGLLAAGEFSGGGIVGDITGGITGAVSSFFGGALDVGKMVAAVATGNTEAFVNAAAQVIGTHAAGDLGQIMIGIPKKLVADMAQQLVGAGSGGSGAYSRVPAQSGPAAAAQKFAAAHLAQFGWGPDQMPPLIALWNEESGWNADAVNPSSGAYGIPQALGKGHPYNLGDYANQVMWGLNYIKDRYGSPAAAYAFENSHTPHWYDDGGWLMPGDMPVNKLSRPEAVLTPDESQAFVQIARQLTAQGVGQGGVGGSKQAIFQFFGTQLPTPEQQAEMDRHLAMALSGV